MRNKNFQTDQIDDIGHTILICSTPAPGHVNPMLTVARHLRAAGYRVIFNDARSPVISCGICPVLLTGEDVSPFAAPGPGNLIANETGRTICSFKQCFSPCRTI